MSDSRILPPKSAARYLRRAIRDAAEDELAEVICEQPTDDSPICTATPGSAEKILLLTKRASAQVSLFQSGDFSPGDYSIANMAALVAALIPGVVEYPTNSSSQLFRAYPLLPKNAASKAGKRISLGYFNSRSEAALEIIKWQDAGCPETWLAAKTTGPNARQPLPARVYRSHASC